MTRAEPEACRSDNNLAGEVTRQWDQMGKLDAGSKGDKKKFMYDEINVLKNNALMQANLQDVNFNGGI